jgi:hypothetical protein
MDTGLERFIAERAAEGHRFVIVDRDAGCIGWGKTPDEAWDKAQRDYPERIGDARCYPVAPGSQPIEGDVRDIAGFGSCERMRTFRVGVLIHHEAKIEAEDEKDAEEKILVEYIDFQQVDILYVEAKD